MVGLRGLFRADKLFHGRRDAQIKKFRAYIWY